MRSYYYNISINISLLFYKSPNINIKKLENILLSLSNRHLYRASIYKRDLVVLVLYLYLVEASINLYTYIKITSYSKELLTLGKYYLGNIEEDTKSKYITLFYKASTKSTSVIKKIATRMRIK
ncbi:hypothetical protein BU16DRAFT_536231 [Lophium mytilinum]|uniref:Uncharacterized protein n=1 Tax=Lophium mytilinum TaxID=390894 RepID=A0A6A6R0C5_9PEZI|nr:hypothetical protein BU16DRAFT_536231 [Lophium mytilinum]